MDFVEEVQPDAKPIASAKQPKAKARLRPVVNVIRQFPGAASRESFGRETRPPEAKLRGQPFTIR